MCNPPADIARYGAWDVRNTGAVLAHAMEWCWGEFLAEAFVKRASLSVSSCRHATSSKVRFLQWLEEASDEPAEPIRSLRNPGTSPRNCAGRALHIGGARIYDDPLVTWDVGRHEDPSSLRLEAKGLVSDAD